MDINLGNKLLFKVLNKNKCWHEWNKAWQKEDFYVFICGHCKEEFQSDRPQYPQTNPHYNTPEGKWKLLEFVVKENPDWWRKFLYAQMFNKEIRDANCRHKSHIVFGMEYMAKRLVSQSFIPDLQQFLAQWIVGRKAEKCGECICGWVECECKTCNNSRNITQQDITFPCPDCEKEPIKRCYTCHGTGFKYSPEIVALAEELLK